jgi:putative sterol carrier protein
MAVAFSDPWAKAWGAALNQSQNYRTTAAGWEGPLAAVVITEDGSPAAAVYLDVWHGECRAARAASAEDIATADFVLEAAPAAWRDLLGGKVAPVMALLTGRVRLARGDLARLLPYSAAAKELIAVGSTIDTEFPAGW